MRFSHRSTLVKHERYFCEFREVMQVEEDKYFEEPRAYLNIYPQCLLFNKKVSACFTVVFITEYAFSNVLTIYICKVCKLL